MEISNLTQQNIAQKTTVNPTLINNNLTASKQTTEATTQSNTRPIADTFSITSSKSITVQQVVTQQVEIALEINSTSSGRAHQDRHDDYKGNHRYGHARGHERGDIHNNGRHSNESLENKVRQKIHEEKSINTKGLSEHESHANAVKSVRIRVEQGLEQATTLLSKNGPIDQSTATGIEQTRTELSQVIDQEAAAPSTNVANDTAVVNAASVNASSAKLDSSTALQVTTRDGDIVTIDISRSQELVTASVDSNDGKLEFASATSNSQLSISIQGELSDKESKPIEKIIKKVNQLAEKLFDGKIGAAIEKLSEFKINTKQLASMSLSMSSSISYSAVSAYTEVSRLPTEAPTETAADANVDTGIVTDASTQNSATAPQVTAEAPTVADNPAAFTGIQVAQETTSDVKEIAKADDFENPFNEIRKLFSSITDMFAHDNKHITATHKDFVKALFNDIMDNVENDAEANDGSNTNAITDTIEI